MTTLREKLKSDHFAAALEDLKNEASVPEQPDDIIVLVKDCLHTPVCEKAVGNLIATSMLKSVTVSTPERMLTAMLILGICIGLKTAMLVEDVEDLNKLT